MIKKKIATCRISTPLGLMLWKNLAKFAPIKFTLEDAKEAPPEIFMQDIIAEGETSLVMVADAYAFGFMTAANAFRNKEIF